jgi:hypothetical protein
LNNTGYLGGEKLFPLSLLFGCKKVPNDLFGDIPQIRQYHINYTFGGHCSLLAIADHLSLKEGEWILLPDYICESMLYPFRQKGLKYKFYHVDEDLIPNVENIKHHLVLPVKAIVFIDYMGSSTGPFIEELIPELKQKGIYIVQDAVQCVDLSIHPFYGDFIFNSYRKFTGIEGSILLSKEKLNIDFARFGSIRFLFYKRLGQFLRYLHLIFPFINAKHFLSLFKIAERYYKSPKIFRLPAINKRILVRIDFSKIARSNQFFFEALSDRLGQWTPKRFRNKNFVPFGFFLVRKDRDLLLRDLQRESIFCPVHWAAPDEVHLDILEQSRNTLSASCLTIPFTYPLTMNLNTLLQKIGTIVINKRKLIL